MNKETLLATAVSFALIGSTLVSIDSLARDGRGIGYGAGMNLADRPGSNINRFASHGRGKGHGAGMYPIVDTAQGSCYDNSGLIDCPAEGGAFYGQDAQYTGNKPSYTDNGDGTVTDNVR